MHDVFEQRSIQYSLRSKAGFKLRSVKSANWGLRALKYLAPKIWSIVPFEIKDLENLEKFKIKIKSWKPTQCPCNQCQSLFRIYVKQL